MMLGDVLQEFVERCNANPRLTAMNRDWTRDVAILATDTGEIFWIQSAEGQLSAGAGAKSGADLEIRADGDVLAAIFSGQMAPTEPYNQGDLLVHGSQDDLLRLDVITLMIWGE